MDKYREEEAEEMIEDGCVNTRQNPMNKKRLQYQVVIDTSFQEVVKEKTLETMAENKVSAEVSSQVSKAISGYSFSIDVLASAALDCPLCRACQWSGL